MEHLQKDGRESKRTYWQQHSEKWLSSGLSQQEYCRANGIALATFGYWRRKLRNSDSAKPQFYPLVISSEALSAGATRHARPGLRVVLGDRRFAIEIDAHFSPVVLQKLVVALEQL